jgi:probable rRNA maturation factor
MVLNRQNKVRVELAPLRAFLKRAKAAARIPAAEVTVCLVSDREMTRLNQAYRRKQGPTDVLSFPAQSPQRKSPVATGRPTAASLRTRRPVTKTFLGDIAIAPETARRYAMHNGRTVRDELRVLILHGVLHLMGYDHETDRGEMDRLEQRLRRRLGLAP